jgi:hypothetical protein
MIKTALLLTLSFCLMTASLFAADQKAQPSANSKEEYSDRSVDQNDDGIIDNDEIQNHKAKKAAPQKVAPEKENDTSVKEDADINSSTQFEDKSLQKEKDKDDKVYKDVDRLQQKLNNA